MRNAKIQGILDLNFFCGFFELDPVHTGYHPPGEGGRGEQESLAPSFHGQNLGMGP
jgi:hypothetical protein